jgi:type IV secretory pathway VirB10-like protein
MTSALSPTRALLVAVACIALLAAWSPVASAQEVPISAAGDVVLPVDPPPPSDPVLDPTPPPAPEPAPESTPPNPPPPPPDPVGEPDPPPPELQGGETKDRPAAHRDEPAARPDSTSVAPQSTAPTVPSDAFTTPEQLPPAGPGEDFALTGEGDAFILASGGSSGGGPTALLSSFSRFGSIATAAARVPALGAGERAARAAAQANAGTSGIVMVDDSGSSGLFLKMFGGGGGGAAMMLLSVLGILAVVRLMPPEGIKDFLESMAIWRPSAYVPPIESPG